MNDKCAGCTGKPWQFISELCPQCYERLVASKNKDNHIDLTGFRKPADAPEFKKDDGEKVLLGCLPPRAQNPSAALHVENRAYDLRMPPHMKRPRPAQGAHIRKLREAAGHTQAELADLVGDTQPNISFWERTNKPPRSDVLPKMAKALGVSVEDLILTDEVIIPHKRPGPVGKLQKTFERAAQLPRAQQERLIELVDTFMRGMQSGEP